MSPDAELLAEIISHLDQKYETYGETDHDAWGSGQWVMYTDDAGMKHYLRIAIMPFKG